MDQISHMPLAGIKVVELATVVAAPTASRMLCAYGADVVKVEAASGDAQRRTGLSEGAPCDDDKNPLFTFQNSNKRLVSLNIKTEAGRKVLLSLLENADVFISNVREAALARQGLDYDSLKERFPRLIYAYFSGYGPKGPAAKNPGFDVTGFWLRSGPMADWQVKGSFPFIPTYAFGDMATSSVLLSGILMAIIGREKTGVGTKVETSLFSSGIWCNGTGLVVTQFGRCLNPDPLLPPDPLSYYYECADSRWIGVFDNEYGPDREKFARVLGMEDILADPRYESLDALTASGLIPDMVRRMNAIFRTRTSAEWQAVFSAANIACQIMQHTVEVLDDPQASENRYIEELEFADGLKVKMPCPPVYFSNYVRRPYTPTGKIGEATDEVLETLGYSEKEISDMRKKGEIL